METWTDKSKYVGDYFKCKKHGKGSLFHLNIYRLGTYYYNDGSVYTGEWKDNNITGWVSPHHSHFSPYIRDPIPGKTEESTSAAGRTTTCTATETIHGKTAGTMKEPTCLTKKTDMAYTHGPMEESTMDNGKMESKTGMATTNTLRIRTEKSGIGRKARESSGSRKRKPTKFLMK